MSSFRTIVEVSGAKRKIKPDESSLFIGSCFTENIGAKMEYFKFNTLMNPFGILYNPESIKQCFEYLLSTATIQPDDLIEHESVAHSFLHHSRFSGAEINALLQKLNTQLDFDREKFKKVNNIFITFGTAWVYEYSKSGKVVSNCHKIPAREFNRFRLNVNHIFNTYKSLVLKIKELNPKVQFVFTVSPVRHFKDGAIENQISKSTLLMAVNELVNEFDCVQYFPAYEIMMDDLRDYRFYDSDMVHPSNVAVDYIWNKFVEFIIDESSIQFMDKVDKIKKAVNHRPFQPQAKAHQAFINKQLQAVQQLINKYPFLNFDDEVEYFESVLLEK